MRKKNNILKAMLLLILMLFVFGICSVSASAAAMPYCIIPESEKPVKIGNSYVWQPSDEEIKVKKSKNSSIESVKGSYEGIIGITDGTTIYYSSQDFDNECFVLGEYSIATGKCTEYKKIEGDGRITGYCNNKIYYTIVAYGNDDYPTYSFDIKTKKIKSVPDNYLSGYGFYGGYLLGGYGYQLKAYNMKTKKFITLSSKIPGGRFCGLYGGEYYYVKYVAKASGDMNKYKIYKFNLKTGKSIPLSKTFTAGRVFEITNKEASYLQIQKGKYKYLTLKY